MLFRSHTVCARSPPSPSCTTTMAESPAHRLDLRVGGKYRSTKMIGSGSFGLLTPSPSCTTTMAESPTHRLDLHVGGKYRLSKNINFGSFGMCCSNLTPFALAHPPHLPALQPWQKVPLTDSISASAASIGSARSLAPVLLVCAVPISHCLCSLTPLTFLHYNHGRKSCSQT